MSIEQCKAEQIMGLILSTPTPPSTPPHDMDSRNCCGHRCYHREGRRRARGNGKKHERGDEALDELLWAAGSLLKEYVKDVKERKKVDTGEQRRERGGVGREEEDRRRLLREEYEGYQGPYEDFEAEEIPLRNAYSRYGVQDVDDEELSPMEQPQGRRPQLSNARGINSRNGPRYRRKSPRPLPHQGFEQHGHPSGFGYANVGRFRHSPQSAVRSTRHDRGPWQGNGSSGREAGGRFSS